MRSIKNRLIIYFVPLLIAVTVIIGATGYYQSEKALRQRIFSGLTALAASKADRISSLVEQDFERMALVASRTQLRKCLADILAHGPNEEKLRETMSNILQDAAQSVESIKWLDVVSLDGEVIASNIPDHVGKWRSLPFSLTNRGALSLSPFYRENGALMYEVTGPMQHAKGGDVSLIGAVVGGIEVARLRRILADYAGLGETGETLLAQWDKDSIAIVSPLRRESSQGLDTIIPKGSSRAKPLQLALAGQTGITIDQDYRGVEVLAAYSHIPIGDWGLVAKIDAWEAFEPIRWLLRRVVLFSLLLLGFSVIVVMMAARVITAPVKELKKGAAAFANGNLDHQIPVRGRDEIASLAGTLNDMARALKQITASREDLNREIEERKEMAASMAEALEFKRKLISASALGILAYDASGQCTLANEAAGKIVGAPEQQMLGQDFREIPSWRESGLLDAAEGVLQDGGERHLHVHITTSFGKDVWLDCHLAPFLSGETTHVLLIIQDVSGQRKMELELKATAHELDRHVRELERANQRILEQQKALIEEERLKVLLQMAGATAHELNQPLTALLGNLELMELHKDDPEKLDFHISRVEDAGSRIAEIVQKIQKIRHYEVRPYVGESEILNLDQPLAVLVVEDNDEDYEKLKEHLENQGPVQIIRKRDLPEALAFLKDNEADIIILDYILPSGTGLEFMEKLEREGIETPVVIVTGGGDEMVASRVIQCGAYDYLPKSKITSLSVGRMISNALEKFRLKNEIKKAVEKMAEMSTRDELTGLFNRRYFMDTLEREIATAQRHGSELALCILDLDHFKQVNDRCGHLAGDLVLRELSAILQDKFRKCDIPCRFGGEEFAIILPRTSPLDALNLCQRIRKTIEDHPIQYEGMEIQVTVSIGLARYDQFAAPTASAFIKAADDALYIAKESGRNRVIALEAKAGAIAAAMSDSGVSRRPV